MIFPFYTKIAEDNHILYPVFPHFVRGLEANYAQILGSSTFPGSVDIHSWS